MSLLLELPTRCTAPHLPLQSHIVAVGVLVLIISTTTVLFGLGMVVVSVRGGECAGWRVGWAPLADCVRAGVCDGPGAAAWIPCNQRCTSSSKCVEGCRQSGAPRRRKKCY